jgi:phosphonate transport system substrate-binding protein
MSIRRTISILILGAASLFLIPYTTTKPSIKSQSNTSSNVYLPVIYKSYSSIGTEENPIRIVFSPSILSISETESYGEILVQALEDETGLFFDVVAFSSNNAAIEEMCNYSNGVIGFLGNTSYVFANDLCSVDVAFKGIKYGHSHFWTGIYVQRNSNISTLDDLNGLNWAYPDPVSLSGYMAPYVMFQEATITFSTTTNAGGHTQSVMAIYYGDADVGTAYFLPWEPPVGVDPWQEGDPPDVPDEVVDSCHITFDDKLMCDGYRILDTRASARSQAPDIIQKVRILTISPGIPNDTISFGSIFPQNLRSQISNSLISISETAVWSDSVQEIYNWSGIEPASDEDFNFYRKIVDAFGLTPDG